MKQNTQKHLIALPMLQYLHYFRKTKEGYYSKQGKTIILSDII